MLVTNKQKYQKQNLLGGDKIFIANIYFFTKLPTAIAAKSSEPP